MLSVLRHVLDQNILAPANIRARACCIWILRVFPLGKELQKSVEDSRFVRQVLLENF